MQFEDKYLGIPVPRHPGDSLGGLTDMMNYIFEILSKERANRVPQDDDLRRGVMDSLVMAEIGCFSGQSTEVFAERVGKLIAVDSWDDATLLGNTALKKYPMANVKNCFLDRMARFGNKITVLHGPSLDMAKHVPDSSLHIVYIDADHRYEAVCQDVLTWIPKLKLKGFIAGHDYNEQNWGPQVSRAVHEVLGKPDRIFRDCSWIKRV